MSNRTDERLAEMLDSARRLELTEWVSAWTELQSLRAQGGVRVKPLEWPNEIKRGQRVMSGHGLIQYTICHYGGDDPNGGTVYRWAAQNEGWHGPMFSYQDAIDAAQADYERRILSAIEAPSEGEVEEGCEGCGEVGYSCYCGLPEGDISPAASSEVTEEMVGRAMRVFYNDAPEVLQPKNEDGEHDLRRWSQDMRAALTAALKGDRS